jgi:hypothetical protein
MCCRLNLIRACALVWFITILTLIFHTLYNRKWKRKVYFDSLLNPTWPWFVSLWLLNLYSIFNHLLCCVLWLLDNIKWKKKVYFDWPLNPTWPWFVNVDYFSSIHIHSLVVLCFVIVVTCFCMRLLQHKYWPHWICSMNQKIEKY